MTQAKTCSSCIHYRKRQGGSVCHCDEVVDGFTRFSRTNENVVEVCAGVPLSDAIEYCGDSKQWHQHRYWSNFIYSSLLVLAFILLGVFLTYN